MVIEKVLQEGHLTNQEAVDITTAIAVPPRMSVIIHADNTLVILFSEPVLALDGTRPSLAHILVHVNGTIQEDNFAPTLTAINSSAYFLSLGQEYYAIGDEILTVRVNDGVLLGVSSGLLPASLFQMPMFDATRPSITSADMSSPGGVTNISLSIQFSEPVLGSGIGGHFLPSDISVTLLPGDASVQSVEVLDSSTRRRAEAPVGFTLVRLQFMLENTLGVEAVWVAPVEGRVQDAAHNLAIASPTLAGTWRPAEGSTGSPSDLSQASSANIATGESSATSGDSSMMPIVGAGVAVPLILGCCVFFFCVRRRKLRWRQPKTMPVNVVLGPCVEMPDDLNLRKQGSKEAEVLQKVFCSATCGKTGLSEAVRSAGTAGLLPELLTVVLTERFKAQNGREPESETELVNLLKRLLDQAVASPSLETPDSVSSTRAGRPLLMREDVELPSEIIDEAFAAYRRSSGGEPAETEAEALMVLRMNLSSDLDSVNAGAAAVDVLEYAVGFFIERGEQVDTSEALLLIRKAIEQTEHGGVALQEAEVNRRLLNGAFEICRADFVKKHNFAPLADEDLRLLKSVLTAYEIRQAALAAIAPMLSEMEISAKLPIVCAMQTSFGSGPSARQLAEEDAIDLLKNMLNDVRNSRDVQPSTIMDRPSSVSADLEAQMGSSFPPAVREALAKSYEALHGAKPNVEQELLHMSRLLEPEKQPPEWKLENLLQHIDVHLAAPPSLPSAL